MTAYGEISCDFDYFHFITLIRRASNGAGLSKGCGEGLGHEAQCCLTSPITLARWVPRASALVHGAHRPLGTGQMSPVISVGQKL